MYTHESTTWKLYSKDTKLSLMSLINQFFVRIGQNTTKKINEIAADVYKVQTQ